MITLESLIKSDKILVPALIVQVRIKHVILYLKQVPDKVKAMVNFETPNFPGKRPG
jgi:hypothetical protein